MARGRGGARGRGRGGRRGGGQGDGQDVRGGRGQGRGGHTALGGQGELLWDALLILFLEIQFSVFVNE